MTVTWSFSYLLMASMDTDICSIHLHKTHARMHIGNKIFKKKGFTSHSVTPQIYLSINLCSVSACTPPKDRLPRRSEEPHTWRAYRIPCLSALWLLFPIVSGPAAVHHLVYTWQATQGTENIIVTWNVVLLSYNVWIVFRYSFSFCLSFYLFFSTREWSQGFTHAKQCSSLPLNYVSSLFSRYNSYAIEPF